MQMEIQLERDMVQKKHLQNLIQIIHEDLFLHIRNTLRKYILLQKKNGQKDMLGILVKYWVII